MAEASETTMDSLRSTFTIHFDVPGHEIPLSTFVRTAEDTAAIVASLNKLLFEGQLKYEILVLPPEHGSFKSRIGLAILAGWGAVWSFTESDIGQAFVEGLTAHPPAYWARQLGEGIRDQLAAAPDDSSPEEEDGQEGESVDDSDEIRCRFSGAIVIEATKSFLQSDTDRLEKAGITISRFREAYAARNDFYNTCAELPDLRAIGFEDEPVFPISRSDFFHLQVALPPAPDDADEPWTVGIVDLKVTSPNWDREDRQRFWKGKDGKGRERLFRIEDEHFWVLVKAERLSIHIIDTIKVQWAFQGKAGSPKNIRVLMVLEFNGEILSEALDKNALNAILGAFSKIEDTQGDLFNDYS
ncbi:hypothetical protein [Sinorhizobium glycinis]|nr:hypothetical protein [Sinorhizobium glycinis]